MVIPMILANFYTQSKIGYFSLVPHLLDLSSWVVALDPGILVMLAANARPLVFARMNTRFIATASYTAHKHLKDDEYFSILVI